MHIVKITPNLIFEYQCTSGKFIRLPNRIEKIDSVAKIESKLFCPNWNALLPCRIVRALTPLRLNGQTKSASSEIVRDRPVIKVA